MTIDEAFRIGEWIATPSLNSLERGGKSVRLEPRTMDLLVYLAGRSGEVVSVEEIISNVWKGVVVGDGSVYLAVSRLRRVLDDEGTRHIETISKRGYRLTAPVILPAVLSAATSGSQRSRGDDKSGQACAWARYRVGKRFSAAAGVGLVIAIMLAGWAISGGWLNAVQNGLRQPSGALAGTAAVESRSADVSRQFFQVYLSQSLEEGLALIDRLTDQYPGLYAAAAHGAKAFLYAQSLTDTYHAASVEAAARARTEQLVAEHAAVALEVDPNTAIAYIALGTRDFYNWRWSAALDAFRHAEQVTSGSTPAYAHGIWLRSYLGEHDRAIALAEEMIRANADNPARSLRFLASAHAYAGDYDRALDNLRVSLDGATGNDVTNLLLVSLEIATGEDDAALSNLGSLAQPVRSYLASLLDAGDATDEALQVLRSRSTAGEPIGAGDWAIAHLAARDTDDALSWLEHAAEKARKHEADESFYSLMFMKMNVAGDPVLKQPAFVDVLDRIRGE